MSDRPYISLTTDFGAAYTGICAGVIARLAPGAQVAVLSDEVTPYAVVEGAMLLRQALPYLPIGTHVAVIDPGVGTERHPLAIRTGRGDVLIGPDNGLLIPAAERLGGIAEARVLSNPQLRLPRSSDTFHGRDVFAPAAAHIALGVVPAEFGDAVEPVPLDIAPPEIAPGVLRAPVLWADKFGTLVLGAEPADLTAALGDVQRGTTVTVAGVPVPYERTYGAVPPGEPLLFTDSSGWLALAVNQGSAVTYFALEEGAPVTVRTA